MEKLGHLLGPTFPRHQGEVCAFSRGKRAFQDARRSETRRANMPRDGRGGFKLIRFRNLVQQRLFDKIVRGGGC